MSFRDVVPQQRFQPTVALSPDGEHVAFSMNDRGRYELRVAPLDGSAGPRSLTADTDQAVRSIAWSPDGTTIAYAADRGGDEQHQIHVVDVGSGEVRRISTVDDRQHDLGRSPFAPDGGRLAYAANDRDPSVQDVVVHDLATGDVTRVESTPGLLLEPVAFSPDGSRLLVLGARSNTDLDACVVDLDVDAPTLDVVTAHDGEERNVPVSWTADGAGCFLVTDEGGERLGIRVLDLATGATRPFEPARGGEWDVEDLVVTPDGSVAVWTTNEGGRSVVRRHRAGETTRLEAVDGVVLALDVTDDGRRAVALVASATRPTDLLVLDLDTDEARFLTNSRPPGLDPATAVEPELVSYRTHDDRMVPGWLYRPHGDGPFPVVLSVHGGPEAQERPGYAYAGLYQHLLSRGVGVFAPNIRGSSGYGRSYQVLIHRDWGGDELRDLEHANRYLRGLDWVDGDRIAVFGGSFGGFATLSCVSRLPDLWACGVSVVGPSNLLTFVESVPPTWRALMARWVGDPEEDEAMLRERSPLTHADDIVCPLMVIQGANDPRVAKAESDQIVESLRSRGVEVRYDVYPDEGHGFTSRENEIRAHGDLADFLIEHLADR